MAGANGFKLQFREEIGKTRVSHKYSFVQECHWFFNLDLISDFCLKSVLINPQCSYFFDKKSVTYTDDQVNRSNFEQLSSTFDKLGRNIYVIHRLNIALKRRQRHNNKKRTSDPQIKQLCYTDSATRTDRKKNP